ncbi:MAG: hypothetical protein EBT95_08110 [Verrucomicrobia bacterium]|nr:hypothetical protein [Verrucomicrobiota bacterium]
MKVSLEWLRDWCDWEGTPTQVADLFTRGGTEVISMRSTGSQVPGVITAKILEKKPHPNADRLTVCQVDDGTGPRQVVCGARNHNAGDIARGKFRGHALLGQGAGHCGGRGGPFASPQGNSSGRPAGEAFSGRNRAGVGGHPQPGRSRLHGRCGPGVCRTGGKTQGSQADPGARRRAVVRMEGGDQRSLGLPPLLPDSHRGEGRNRFPGLDEE